MTGPRAAASLREFLASEAAGGLVLIGAAALAMVAANSPLAPAYFAALHLETGPVIAPAIGPMTVHLWINDALMAVFFLLVGLEIKRELIEGELATAARRRLPIIAAAAGMIVPAIVYLFLSGGAAALRSGWPIASATDIAFAMGVLALLGSRVPPALRLFLATVAIVDDMGAVAIIALVYSHGLSLLALAGAAAVAAGMALLGRLGILRVWPYLLGGLLLWVLILISGIHATIAGVVTAMLIPIRPDPALSPLHRIEHALAPWVGFVIVPLFGFANAGVSLGGAKLTVLVEPLVLAIALGLFLGKQAGIFGGVRLAVALGLARRPAGASWMQLYGVALLAGIGFTMSLFIGGLAFPGNAAMLDTVKIGVLAGSILSAITGFAVLRLNSSPTDHRIMKAFFDPRQLAHAPAEEFHNGGFMAFSEMPARAEAIAAAIGGADLPDDHGETAIRAVHDAGYLEYLKNGPALWKAAGRPGDMMGYVWPIVGRRPLRLDRVDALAGRYSFDASTPLAPETWEAAYWSTQSGLSALDAVLAGDRAAFALCRPPGHHAGADYLGGYCYLNTAAIVVQAARDAGKARVAILDIDYHHGNGTQDIFWTRGDVFYASIHADPATDYPFYWGHADEVGEEGGQGATLNLPLPQGVAFDGFRAAQAQALAAIGRFAPDLLVLSFGADTWDGDPLSGFRLKTADYALLARDIAACGWPTVIVMEGGYAIEALGANVTSLLSGF